MKRKISFYFIEQNFHTAIDFRGFDAGALENHFWEFFHIEEIFISKVVVPCLYVRVDRIHIHYETDFRVCEILFINIHI